MDLALGRLTTLFLKFPNHELFDKTIACNFCARLPALDRERLDIFSKGHFNIKVFKKLEILLVIDSNNEIWEMDKGYEGGRNFEYECIKICFSETDVFNDMSTKYGLDFEVPVNLF